MKSWPIWRDPDAGKDWGREEKGTTEDEMVGWHHQHNGHGFEYTPGVGDGQGALACCSPWGRKELDTTEQLNWTELNLARTHQTAWKARQHPSSSLCLLPLTPSIAFLDDGIEIIKEQICFKYPASHRDLTIYPWIRWPELFVYILRRQMMTSEMFKWSGRGWREIF